DRAAARKGRARPKKRRLHRALAQQRDQERYRSGEGRRAGALNSRAVALSPATVREIHSVTRKRPVRLTPHGTRSRPSITEVCYGRNMRIPTRRQSRKI